MKREFVKKYLWLIMLFVVSLLQGVIPVIYSKRGQSGLVMPVVVVLVLVHIALAVWLILTFVKRTGGQLSIEERVAKSYQIALRIGAFVLIWVVFLMGVGGAHSRFTVTEYDTSVGFLEQNALLILRAFAFTVTLNLLFGLVCFVRVSTERFWLNTFKVFAISLIPVFVITMIAVLVAAQTGVVLDVLVTWLLWTLDIVILMQVRRKIS